MVIKSNESSDKESSKILMKEKSQETKRMSGSNITMEENVKRKITCCVTPNENTTALPTLKFDKIMQESNVLEEENDKVESEAKPRKQLENEMLKRNKSLTARELTFLTSLVQDGKEEHVLKAQKRLSDRNLFFDKIEKPSTLPTRAQSEDVTAILSRRRNSALHDQMWKAHLEGISIGTVGSTKSIKHRSSSMSTSRSPRQENGKKLLPATSLRVTHRQSKNQSVHDLSTLQKPASLQNRARAVSFGPTTLNEIKETQVTAMEGNEDCTSTAITVDSLAFPTNNKECSSSSDLNISSIIITENDDQTECSAITTSNIQSTPMSTIPGIAKANRLRHDSFLDSESLADELPSPSRTQSSSSLKTTNSIPGISKANRLRHDSFLESDSLADELHYKTHSSNSLRTSYTTVSATTEERTSNDRTTANNWSIWKEVGKSDTNITKPVLIRQSSTAQGGVEVANFETVEREKHELPSLFVSTNSLRSILTNELKKSPSHDDLLSSNIVISRDEGDDDDSTKSLLGNMSCVSWDAVDSSDQLNRSIDAWDVFQDEYAVGYGANNSLTFSILGTNATDTNAKPHVLSPPLMDSIKSFLPYSITDENFWLKYSLVRDGASLFTMLQHVRGTNDTILAIETLDGDVFGSFTHSAWKIDHDFYGNGQAFLWKMRRNRHTTPCFSILDQAILESELDVYLWTGLNEFVQFCHSDRIGLGGGDGAGSTSTNSIERRQDDTFVNGGGNFGIVLESDLLTGSSGPTDTFNNPSLASSSSDGIFEVVNLEIWTLTPCQTENEAEQLDMNKLFFSNQNLE